jgi:hypothetical protein
MSESTGNMDDVRLTECLARASGLDSADIRKSALSKLGNSKKSSYAPGTRSDYCVMLPVLHNIVIKQTPTAVTNDRVYGCEPILSVDQRKDFKKQLAQTFGPTVGPVVSVWCNECILDCLNGGMSEKELFSGFGRPSTGLGNSLRRDAPGFHKKLIESKKDLITLLGFDLYSAFEVVVRFIIGSKAKMVIDNLDDLYLYNGSVNAWVFATYQ